MEALFTNTSLCPTSSSSHHHHHHHHHHLTKLSHSSLSFLTPSKPQPLSTTHHLLITIPTASSMSSNETLEAEEDQELRQVDDASFGEVHKIIGSRVGEEGKNKMEYLIEWKDGDTPSWVPGENIASDIVAEYETPWWKAAKSADASSLQSLFDDPNSLRSIDAVDLNGRTALIFAAGLGDDECVRILASGGADLNRPDESGLTALHMAAGYVRPETVKTLLELGADPEVIDGKGRTPVQLAREVMGMTPPGQLVRRMGLQAVVKVLEAAEYEFAEVEKIIERRRGGGGRSEYLVEWRDGGGREWVDERFVAEDLAKDYDAGLEYAVAEVVAAKREVEGGGWEYLVKWADIEEPTWELAENIDVELVAEFERRAEQSHEPAGVVKSGDRST